MATTASDKQADYILRLANELTGERARYVSQSSVIEQPRNGWGQQEASLLIDDLKSAIEAEKQRAASGAVTGARVTFGYTWNSGDKSQVTGEIVGYKWDDGYRVDAFRVRLDEAARAAAPHGKEHGLCRLSRITGLVVLGENDGEREILAAERAALAARIAEIDKLLDQ